MLPVMMLRMLVTTTRAPAAGRARRPLSAPCGCLCAVVCACVECMRGVLCVQARPIALVKNKAVMMM